MSNQNNSLITCKTVPYVELYFGNGEMHCIDTIHTCNYRLSVLPGQEECELITFCIPQNIINKIQRLEKVTAIKIIYPFANIEEHSEVFDYSIYFNNIQNIQLEIKTSPDLKGKFCLKIYNRKENK